MEQGLDDNELTFVHGITSIYDMSISRAIEEGIRSFWSLPDALHRCRALESRQQLRRRISNPAQGPSASSGPAGDSQPSTSQLPAPLRSLEANPVANIPPRSAGTATTQQARQANTRPQQASASQPPAPESDGNSSNEQDVGQHVMAAAGELFVGLDLSEPQQQEHMFEQGATLLRRAATGVADGFPAHGEEECDADAFSRLPSGMCEVFLQQVFLQLPRQELLRVVALVCRRWCQLSVSSCSSLELRRVTPRAARALACWVGRHSPSALSSLSLELADSQGPQHSRAVGALLQAAAAGLPALRSLSIGLARDVPNQWADVFPGDLPLAPLTGLTRLQLQGHVDIPSGVWSLLLELSQLQCLQLQCQHAPGIPSRQQQDHEGASVTDCSPALVDIASSLVQLTCLELGQGLHLPGRATVLTQLTSLQRLVLGCPSVAPRRLSALQQLPLAVLSLDIGAGQVEPVCSWLQAAGRHLEELWLCEGGRRQRLPPISPREASLLLSELAVSAPRLRRLYMYVSRAVLLAPELSRLTQLNQLYLGHEAVESETLQAVAALTGLERLWLDTYHLARGPPLEALASSLRELAWVGVEYHEAADAVRAAFAGRVLGYSNNPNGHPSHKIQLRAERSGGASG